MAPLLLYLSLLVLVFPGSNGNKACTFQATKPCQCTFNGTTIDISKYFNNYPIDPTSNAPDEYSYKYSCENIDCKGDNTEKGVACQISADGKTIYQLGKANENTQWTIVSDDPLEFLVMYKGGNDGRVTNVRFKYEKSTMQGVVTTSKSKVYNITISGDRVKIGGGGGGGGNSNSSGGGNKAGPVGIVIIVLALAAFITYFIVGGIYMYRVKGARGMEVVPHYAFWKDLPFLIKDGFFFTISPCYKRSKAYENL